MFNHEHCNVVFDQIKLVLGYIIWGVWVYGSMAATATVSTVKSSQEDQGSRHIPRRPYTTYPYATGAKRPCLVWGIPGCVRGVCVGELWLCTVHCAHYCGIFDLFVLNTLSFPPFSSVNNTIRRGGKELFLILWPFWLGFSAAVSVLRAAVSPPRPPAPARYVKYTRVYGLQLLLSELLCHLVVDQLVLVLLAAVMQK